MVRFYQYTTRRHVIVGNRYGRWKVVSSHGRDEKGNLTWNCVCECGNTGVVRGSNLLNSSSSCGCLKREVTIMRNFRHGGSKSPEYRSWLGIISRCTCKTNTDWPYYGGRDIRICDRWKAFKNFLADMGTMPKPGSTIERLDNNGNYEPGNCVWASRKVQGRNKRNVPLFEYQGEKKSIAEWAELFKIHPETLRKRVRRGWPMEQALKRAPRPIRGVHYASV